MGSFDRYKNIIGSHIHDSTEGQLITNELYDIFHDLLDAEQNKADEPDPNVEVNSTDIEDIRETFLWGTYWKNRNEPLRTIVLKDVSDSHLARIIGHLITHKSPDTLIIMLEEARYRNENNIFVPDYPKEDHKI